MHSMLNYTNPMAMLTWMHSIGSSIQNVGLCHSVQGTTKKLAKGIDVPYEDVSYLVAGINHQAWILKFIKDGQDLYPRIFKAVDTHPSFKDDHGAGRDDEAIWLFCHRKHPTQFRIPPLLPAHSGIAGHLTTCQNAIPSIWNCPKAANGPG